MLRGGSQTGQSVHRLNTTVKLEVWNQTYWGVPACNNFMSGSGVATGFVLASGDESSGYRVALQEWGECVKAWPKGEGAWHAP